MNCPHCETRFEKRHIHGIELDECPSCRGLWFDPGEFRKIKDEAEPDLRWLDTDLWMDQEDLEVEESARQCPICDRNMAAVFYPSTEVAIDYCTHYHGIWLDAGEFENIISALEKEMDATTAPEYLRIALDQAKEIVTGTEGFISESKDLVKVMGLLQLRILADNPTLGQALDRLQSSHPLG